MVWIRILVNKSRELGLNTGRSVWEKMGATKGQEANYNPKYENSLYQLQFQRSVPHLD